MRTFAASALLLFLSVVSCPGPAKAQSSWVSLSPALALTPNQSSAAPTTEPKSSIPGLRAPAASPNAFKPLQKQAPQSSAFPSLEASSVQQKDQILTPGSVTVAAVSPDANVRCAHIIISRRPSVDSSMASSANGSSDRMPAVSGLPVCPQDVRDPIIRR
jgi:hypothetical protein